MPWFYALFVSILLLCGPSASAGSIELPAHQDSAFEWSPAVMMMAQPATSASFLTGNKAPSLAAYFAGGAQADRETYRTGSQITMVGGVMAIAALPIWLVAGMYALVQGLNGESQAGPTMLAYIGLGSFYGGLTLAAVGTVVAGSALRRMYGIAPPWAGVVGLVSFVVVDITLIKVLAFGADSEVEGVLIGFPTLVGLGFTTAQLVINIVQNKRHKSRASRGPAWGVSPMIQPGGVRGMALTVRL